MKQSHFDIDYGNHVIQQIFSAATIKSIFAFFLLGFSWVFDGGKEILYTIYLLILLDTILGCWLALRKNEINSRGFYTVTIKCFIYFIMIVVSRLVDKHLPIQMAAPIMDSFLVGTEAISILENIGALGFAVPTALLKKLKNFNEKK